MKDCKVEWPNVWTSKGKALAGDVVALDDEEAEAMRDLGAVSFKRGRKKESEDAE